MREGVQVTITPLEWDTIPRAAMAVKKHQHHVIRKQGSRSIQSGGGPD